MHLSDEHFLAQFADKSLPPEQFTHIGHLRLAWLHLRQNSLEHVVNELTNGIDAYATNLGAAEKFHFTITEALLRVMNYRMSLQSQTDFDSFLKANTDLQQNALAVLYQYYSEERLHSLEAKQKFIAPDKQPFETINQDDKLI